MSDDWELLATRWSRVAEQCAQMARDLLVQEAVEDTLGNAVAWSMRIVEGCDAAAITTARRDTGVVTAAASGPLAAESDRLQNEFREGPCRDALWEEDSFYSPDLEQEGRWQQYAPAAAKLGIRSVLGIQLFTGENTLGALNLYATKADAFDEVARRAALIVAAHAAVAFEWARTHDQLHQAIESRQIIGAAIGLVIERLRLTPDEAFALLVRASNHRNLKLRAIAERIVETGELPEF